MGHGHELQGIESEVGSSPEVSGGKYLVKIHSGHGSVVGDNNIVEQHFHAQSGPEFPIRVGRPPLLAEWYLDRPRLTIEIMNGLHPVSLAGAESPVVLLIGDGGVGKTQLAVSCWYEHTAVDLAVWISGSSRTAIKSGLALGAQRLSLSQPGGGVEQQATGFLDWLSTTRISWLIVIDDLQDASDMMSLWPVGPTGCLLVTSRSRDMALRRRGRFVVEVDVFTPEEALAYLRAKLADVAIKRPNVMDEANLLVADLGYLPLALAQAAAVLRDVGGMTCARYRESFADRSSRVRELLPADVGDEHLRTTGTTWSLAIDRADLLAPTGAARKAALFVSLLNPNGIPKGIFAGEPFREYLQQGLERSLTDEEANAVLGNLNRFSVIVYDESSLPRSVRMHPLAQRATRELAAGEEINNAAAHAAEALNVFWPQSVGRTALSQALRDCVTNLLANTADLLFDSNIHPVLFNAGGSLGDSGLVAVAVEYFNDIIRIAQRVLGPEHPDTLTARANYAYWLGEAGDPNGALRELAQILDDRRRVLGPLDPATLQTRSRVALWRGQAGDSRGAAAAFADLLADMLAVLGPDHRNTLRVRHDLAYWRGESGDPLGAANALPELLADRIRLLGPDDPDTLLNRSHLALWRGRAGYPSEAVEELSRLLEDRVRVLGADHPNALATRANLARWVGESGDAAGAVVILRDLLADRLRVLGPKHPHTLMTRNDLAYWRGAAGEPSEAVSALIEILADRRTLLSEDHPHILETRNDLAHWRGEAGDAAGAVAALTGVLTDSLRILGADHGGTLKTRAHLARWVGESGDPAQATSDLEALLIDATRELGAENPLTKEVAQALERWRLVTGSSDDTAV